ncbi:zinc finger MYM-type protein 1-like [Melanaphis sacchari]|uniref:zinc finger MYM-type protein 1-like n=1 Tax=Melanaphis sacchari TaxID=742174 RepID=UPI000DC13474|nr:zinc finger MYM-type protein 1-like [Melanaphis sacchari]
MDKSSESSAKAKLEKFLFKKDTDIQNTESSKINSEKNQNIIDQSIITNCDSLKDGQDSPIQNFTSNYELKNTSSENDISFLLDNVKLNLQERLEFMNTIWTPDFSYNFPIKTVGKKHLKFQASWLLTWKWLSYSKIRNGAFCKYCVIFSQKEGGIGKQSLGMLCTKEFSNWKHAIEKFKNHEETGYHKTCIENYKVMSQKNYTPINMQINKAMAAELIENRKLVMPVIESVIFCGRQGLSLRGHNDSGPLVMEHEPIENDGNFRAVLRYGLRMNSMGNSDLQLIRERCKRNAQYISPKIQNEIVNICFCVLADETADVAGIEQFSICARYIYNNEIKEDFLNFVPVESTTGENLAHTLIKSLENFGINIQYLRGQGYDGAASMSGRFNGVQSIIKKQYKTAVYVHCSAHVLNLVICSSCEMACIRNAMGVIETVYNFMNTPKRQCVLQKKHESIRTFIDLQEAIVSSLEIMAGWVDKETSSKATQLLFSLSDTTFNVSLMVIDEVFKHSYILCKALQRDNIDLIEAMNLAEDLTNEVKQMRQNSDENTDQS